MSNSLRNTDPNDDPVTYSASGLPDGLSINSGTGVVTGTIDLRPAHPTEEGSPGRDEDVKPDLFLDPREQDPDQPPEPPGNPDH
jgi:hypothetical protein